MNKRYICFHEYRGEGSAGVVPYILSEREKDIVEALIGECGTHKSVEFVEVQEEHWFPCDQYRKAEAGSAVKEALMLADAGCRAYAEGQSCSEEALAKQLARIRGVLERGSGLLVVDRPPTGAMTATITLEDGEEVTMEEAQRRLNAAIRDAVDAGAAKVLDQLRGEDE